MNLPPYAALIGIVPDPAPDTADATVLLMPFAEGVLGRPGFLHGGAIAGLLEMAAFVAATDALAGEGGGRIKPVTITVDYLRGGRDHPTRAAGTVTRLGRRVANVEATAWQDARDRPIAAARFTFLLEERTSPAA